MVIFFGHRELATSRQISFYNYQSLTSLLGIIILFTFSFSSNLVVAQADSSGQLLAPARQGGLWGYINPRGEWLIPPQYGMAKNFNENLAEVVMYREDNIVSGFINKENKLMIELPELNYSNLSEGMLPYLEKEAYGYMDSTGAKVIPAQFRYCSNFKDGKAMVVFKNGKAGYINKKKQLLLSPRWDTAFSYSGKFAVVGKKDLKGHFKYGIIDQYGNHLIPPQYTMITSLSEGKAFANQGGTIADRTLKGGKWYIVDMDKQRMLPLCDTTLNIPIDNYFPLIRFDNGYSWFPGNYKGQLLLGLMNEEGDWTVLPQYKFVNAINENLAGVYLGGKMGFINLKGKYVIPCIYQAVGSFQNGLAWFKDGRKYGYLNTSGAIVIPPTFDEVGDFMLVK
jgi:hypothetical protein